MHLYYTIFKINYNYFPKHDNAVSFLQWRGTRLL